MMLTQDKLKEELEYNKDTGVFVRLKNRGGILAGAIAGHLHHTGYMRIMVMGKRYQSHRLAWLYIYGEWPKKYIDHINHNKADNRLFNLREVTRTENGRSRSLSKTNKSGILGVIWHKRDNIWQSCIRVDGRQIYLGRSINKFEAACLRKSAEIKYGYHENHGMKSKI